MENEAETGAAIAIENLLYQSANVQKSRFERNKAGQALIHLNLAVMAIDSTNFLDNEADNETPGFMIALSRLDVTRSTFSSTKKEIVVE